MLRKILIGLGALVGLVVLAVAGLFGYASMQVSKTYDTPLPNIQRDSSPEGVARGAMIFKSMCIDCHAKPGEEHAIGAEVKGLPPELGLIHSANVTSDPVGGVGNVKDEEIARMIIHAINREGKVRPMNQFRGMADADIAAVIGFMRSGDPLFAPEPKKAPPSNLTAMGNIVQAFVLGINPTPRASVKAPPKAATVEYGKYLADAVYDCGSCHTAGLANNEVKVASAEAYTGGFEFDLTSLGTPGVIYSQNITPHETQGIGKWTLDQFKLALRQGINPEQYVLRYPMPRFRHIDDVEIEAIFAYLKSLPAKEPAKLGKTPLSRPKADAEGANPEKLFTSLGCSYCHGPNGQFRDRLKNSLTKQPEDVAKWIRNPESFKPGTQMPTFESLVDENQALSLAKWVQEKKGEP